MVISPARFESPDTEPMVYDRVHVDEVVERIADCERRDRVLLRMVLAAALATAVLAIAGALVA
jgi:hypothetical protein